MKSLTKILLLLLLTTGGLFACGESTTATPNQDETNQNNQNQDELGNIIAVLEADGNFTILLAALEAAELTSTLDGNEEFTIFAPTDDVFEEQFVDDIDELLAPTNQEERQNLRDGLLPLILTGSVLAAELDAGFITTLSSLEEVEITIEGANIRFGGAPISRADVMASNGVIHELEDLPEYSQPTIMGVAERTDEFSTLVDAIIQAGLADLLSSEGPFTLFAPTNDAFEDSGIDLSAVEQDELIDILRYHLLEGLNFADDSGLVVPLNGSLALMVRNSEMVTYGDASFSTDLSRSARNGRIYTINSVVLPPGDLVEVAGEEDDLSLFLTTVTRADLTETLAGDDAYTIFAPTNAAFEDAGFDAAAIEATEPEVLADVLMNHVMEGAFSVFELELGDVETLSELEVEIASGDGLTFGGAKIDPASLIASNGVIQVIDQVINPQEPDPTIYDLVNATDDFSTLLEALIQAELVDVLSGDGPFTLFAPSNQAFIDAGINLAAYSDDQAALIDILTFHVLQEEVAAADVELGIVTAKNGAVALIEEDGDDHLTYAGARITETDNFGSNGVIHTIDSVVVPPGNLAEVASDAGLELLLAAFTQVGFDTFLTNPNNLRTIFAPTDAAFLEAGIDADAISQATSEELAELISFHMLWDPVSSYELEEGPVETFLGEEAIIGVDNGFSFADADITTVDLMGRNGVIHIIDGVGTPPSAE